MAYGTNEGLTAYLALTGRALIGDPDQARQAGSIYIDGFEDRLKSSAVDYNSAFPRTAFNPTPERVEWAVYEAALIWDTDPAALSSSASLGSTVKREKVEGAVEVEYFGDSGDESMIDAALPKFTVIEGLMKPFMRRTGAYVATAYVV